MKKLIVKSISITLLIIATVTMLTILIATAFFPSFVSDLAFTTGNKSLCVKYSEKQYLKSNSDFDLALLVERSFWADDDETSIKYGAIFINDENFNSFCNTKDDNYKYFIVGSYCQALYENGEKQKSIDTAFVRTEEYTQTNPIRLVSYLATTDNDKALATKIRDLLLLRGDSQTDIVKADILVLETFINS